ncbi:MAG: hypothetical protein IJV70_07120 [Clostridia bacterium]|nr:hypothetical protein [Clostridia bacterium]
METRAAIVEIEAETLAQAQEIARGEMETIRNGLSAENWLSTELRVLDEEYSPLFSEEYN